MSSEKEEEHNSQEQENNPQENQENYYNDNQNRENIENEAEEDPIEVEVEDRGINTDELPPEELQRLVDNNKELQEENEVSNMAHEIRENKENQENKNSKRKLIEELNEKDKIFELLVKTNNQLKTKIELSNKKYQEILEKIATKKKEDIENKLNLQIKELDKSIKANNSETERYKKMIDQLKTKIEFKENLDRVSSIQYILKQESLKNKDLQNELNALKRINKAQEKYIENYNKENQVTEKLENDEIIKNDLELNNKDKADEKTEKRYHRRYRNIKSSPQKKKEGNENNIQENNKEEKNNNNKISSNRWRYRGKK